MLWSSLNFSFLSEDLKQKLNSFSQEELNKIDDNGYSLLSYALLNGTPEVVEFLLKDLNLDPKKHARGSYENEHYKENNKPNPLWVPSLYSQNSIEKIKLLSKYGANLNELDHHGMSLLTNCLFRSISILPFLAYVDLNQKAYYTPLQHRDEDEKEQAPIQLAISLKKSAAILGLIEAGANIDTRDNLIGNSLMHQAAIYAPEIIEILSKRGLSVNETNKIGLKPIHFATATQNIEAIKILLQLNANTDLKATINNLTFDIGHFIVASPILRRMFYSENEDKLSTKNIVTLLRYFPNAVNHNNYKQIISELIKAAIPSLHYILDLIKNTEIDLDENSLKHPEAKSYIETLEETIEIAIDFAQSVESCKNNKCQDDIIPTEVYAVIQNDQTLLAKILKEKPEVLNSKYKGLPLLQIAMLFENLECTKTLLDYPGIDLESKDKTGDNVLAGIIPLKDFALVENLIDRGVSIDSLDNNFNSPADKILHQFGNSNYDQAVELVTKHSKDPINKLMALGKEYRSYTFDKSKTNVAIATSDGFWSTDHLATARKVMKKNPKLQISIVNKDQIDEEFLKNFNGFIIPGGGDSYPQEGEFTFADLSEEKMVPAEKLYKHVLSIADKYSIPVMGFCLGAQYIGLHSGASLISTAKHFGGKHTGLFVKGTMPYFMTLSKTEQKQLLDYNYIPEINFRIDTAHTFAVVANKPGKAVIGAFSDAGVVEAVAYNNHMFGYQFHPENFYEISVFGEKEERATNIIDNFMALTTQHKQWHSFSIAEGFSYEDAQDALNKANIKLQQKISETINAQSPLISSYLELPVSNITKSEFHLPEPELDSFTYGTCYIISDKCMAPIIKEEPSDLPAIYDSLAEIRC